jgi:hypothetical protein
MPLFQTLSHDSQNLLHLQFIASLLVEEMEQAFNGFYHIADRGLSTLSNTAAQDKENATCKLQFR